MITWKNNKQYKVISDTFQLVEMQLIEQKWHSILYLLKLHILKF